MNNDFDKRFDAERKRIDKQYRRYYTAGLSTIAAALAIWCGVMYFIYWLVTS